MTTPTLSQDRLTIRSTTGSATLTFSDALPDDDAHPVSSFLVTLEFRETFVSLRAATRIGVGDGSHLLDFFRGVIRDASGFVGVREWASRERELVLRADHDGSSRLVLTVLMRPEYEPPPFTAEYRLRIPFDALQQTTADLVRFIRAS